MIYSQNSDLLSQPLRDRLYNINITSNFLMMIDTRKLNLNYITNNLGEKTAVILPIEEFEQLLEDMKDLAIVAERRNEPTTSYEDLITELKQDSIL